MKYSQYSPATCGHGYFAYGLSLSILFVVYMFFMVGIDQTFAKFYFSYLKFDKFGISTNGASWAIILFWLSFSVSLFLSFFLSSCEYLDWSFNWCYSICFYSCSHMFGYYMVWRFTSSCSMDALCLDSWSYFNKSFCSWFINWIHHFTSFSSINCLDQSKT